MWLREHSEQLMSVAPESKLEPCWFSLISIDLVRKRSLLGSAQIRSARKSTQGQKLARHVKTLASETRMQPFEYRSVSYWSKEINGALTVGQKK